MFRNTLFALLNSKNPLRATLLQVNHLKSRVGSEPQNTAILGKRVYIVFDYIYNKYLLMIHNKYPFGTLDIFHATAVLRLVENDKI
jgi:hypothetical protein